MIHFFLSILKITKKNKIRGGDGNKIKTNSKIHYSLIQK